MSDNNREGQRPSDTELYAGFMGEVKTRMKAVHRVLSALRPSQNPGEEAFLDAEAAILQIRFVCELIALASLSAHSELGLSLSLLKSYHAGNIFRDLERLNPHSFPKAIKPFVRGPEIELIVKPEAIGRVGLEEIYNGCGNLLHRGVLKNAMRGAVRNYDMSKVDGWANSIQNLLSHHTIAILERGMIFVVTMNSPNDGDVEVIALRMIE